MSPSGARNAERLADRLTAIQIGDIPGVHGNRIVIGGSQNHPVLNRTLLIERYCSYLGQQVTKIQIIQDRLYQKVLFMAILDTLGRTRHPTTSGNRKRFIELISSSACWPDAERVSLYQLSLSLSQSAPSTLSIRAHTSIQRWQYGKMHGLEVDPFINDLDNTSLTVSEKDALNNCRHANLLYTYRNYLIHEFREPGHGSEMDHNDTAPYYHGLSHMNSQGTIEKDTWELVYPLGFFVRLVETTLKSIRSYLRDNHLDPYSFYKFDTMWKRTI